MLLGRSDVLDDDGSLDDVLVVRDVDVVGSLLDVVGSVLVEVVPGVVREREVEVVGSSSSLRSQSGADPKSMSESRMEPRPPLMMVLRSEKSGIS